MQMPTQPQMQIPIQPYFPQQQMPQNFQSQMYPNYQMNYQMPYQSPANLKPLNDIQLLKAKDPSKKIAAIIVSFSNGDSYDDLFRKV
jgi:hypothetical protein